VYYNEFRKLICLYEEQSLKSLNAYKPALFALAITLFILSLFGYSTLREFLIGSTGTPINIHFGHWKEWGPSSKVGSAAIGEDNDFWNVVAVPWNDDHTEVGLLDAQRIKSDIQIRMVNLGGGWAQVGELGLDDPMLSTYNYPQNNQGGESQIEISNLQQGSYTLYIYGTSAYKNFYGDYSVSVDDKKYGRKVTQSGLPAVNAKSWTEGIHYVRFSGILSPNNGEIKITIHESKPFAPPFRTDTNALISGLQLIKE